MPSGSPIKSAKNRRHYSRTGAIKRSPNAKERVGQNLVSHVPSDSKAAPCYVPFRISASRQFRDLCLHTYPGLNHPENGQFYWRLLEYLLNSDFEDSEGRLIIPAVTVATLAKVKPNKRGFRAIDHLLMFSRDVFPLHDIREHRYKMQEARTVARALPKEIEAAWLAEDAALDDGDRVWFVDGRSAARASKYRHVVRCNEELREIAAEVNESHPAHELITYLNGHPQTVLSRLLRSNWEAMKQAYHALPDGDEGDSKGARQSKLACHRTLHQISDFGRVLYNTADKTPRIYAMGSTINQLPRHIRKITLRGCVEFDVRACQLAIVARLWNLPRLAHFIGQRDKSIWEEFQERVGGGPEYKDLFKRAVYAIVFGMQRRNLHRLLLNGGENMPGLEDREKVRRFLSHGIITELLRERARQLAHLRRNGEIVDAFGLVTKKKGRTLRSLMAQQVQSYEMKLMLSVLPLIKSNKNAHIVSWLHDGITVWFTDKSEAAQLTARIVRTFNCECGKMGINTELEPIKL